MGYNLVFKGSVAKDLARLDKPVAKRILKQIEAQLPGQADQHPMLKGDLGGLRKYRIGETRVMYAIIEKDVQVLRNGKRKDVYR